MFKKNIVNEKLKRSDRFRRINDYDFLMKTYREMNAFHDKHGRLPSISETSEKFKVSKSRVQDIHYILRSLGIIDFEEHKIGKRRNLRFSMRVSVKMLPGVLCKLYSREDYLLVRGLKNGKNHCSFRRVYFLINPSDPLKVDAYVRMTIDGVRRKMTLKEWHGYEFANGESYWTKEYTVGERHTDERHVFRLDAYRGPYVEMRISFIINHFFTAKFDWPKYSDMMKYIEFRKSDISKEMFDFSLKKLQEEGFLQVSAGKYVKIKDWR